MQQSTEVGSYPGHLSEVRVHVLVTDWNHLPDAPVVTVERDTVKTNYQVISVSSFRKNHAVDHQTAVPINH